MRILAIRGCNITSLAGNFALELDAPPLAGVGLFSITGPTGSGKSSILDTLCLALFATAPRLDGQGSVRIGRDEDGEEQRISAGDPRSLIRRGAASGFAEVDFVGRDGYRYRARWEARRAHLRVNGRFQDWTLKLENLDNEERYGARRTEVLKEIEGRLGLTYQQFRRAALLAQGDFAAFLQEKSDQRAKLLEEMTGAELYTNISKAAFERAKKANAELRAREAAIGAVPLLEEAARRELEASLSTLSQARSEEQARVERAEAIVRYFDELIKLRALEGEAIEEQKRIAEENEEAAELREEMRTIERALPLRPYAHREREALKAREAAVLAHQQADQQLAALNLKLAKAMEDLSLCQESQKSAKAKLDAARPELEAASKLDTLIGEKQNRLAQAEAQKEQASARREEIAEKARALDEQIAGRRASIAEIKDWLQVRASVAPLEKDWEVFHAELRRFVEAHREAKALREAKGPLEERDKALRTELEALQESFDEAERAALASKALAEQAEKAAAEAGFSEGDREERDRIQARQKALDAMVALCEQAEGLEKSIKREREEEADAGKSAEIARKAAAEAEAAIPVVKGELAEAKRALEQTRMTLDLEGHRAKLEDGAPCPLCGSEAHPYAKDGGPALTILKTQEERVANREERLRLIEKTLTEQRTLAEGLDKSMLDARARAQGFADNLQALQRKWSELAQAVSIDIARPSADGLMATRQLAEKGEARLLALREAEQRASRLSAELAKYQREWQRAREEIEAKAKALEMTRERLREVTTELSRHVEGLSRLDKALDKGANELAPALDGRGNWRDVLFANPEDFTNRRAKEVIEYRARSEELKGLGEDLVKLQAEDEKVAAILEERAKALAEIVEEVAKRQAALDEDRKARAALLGGRPTDEARRELEAALEKASLALEAAVSAEKRAQEEASLAMQALAGAESARAHAASAVERATIELGEQLTRAELSRESLEASLAREEAWIARAREELLSLDNRIKQSAMRIEERSRARVAHEEKDRPEVSEGVAREGLASARQSLQTAVESLAQAQSDLRRDDEARALQKERSEAFKEEQKAAERWQALDTLIGSADGKKFRSFAQSLTLDALIAYANEHLGDLAPRYRLMRVPGQDMDLQVVDGDMGDEIRGINSLSGGETFLVSLALALALSSLASRDIRIDTLFVDEGFGSLDPHTLEVAIAALDSLQATGRQVGVISHVQAMADKIGSQVRVKRLGAGKSRLVLVNDIPG